jgi:DNA-binding Lrp family transcriptional regulator
MRKKKRSSDREKWSMNIPKLNNPQHFIKGNAEAIVLITTTHGEEKNVIEELSQIDALNEAYIVHGPYHILARFKSKNYECLSELLNIRIKKINGIKRTRNLLLPSNAQAYK